MRLAHFEGEFEKRKRTTVTQYRDYVPEVIPTHDLLEAPQTFPSFLNDPSPTQEDSYPGCLHPRFARWVIRTSNPPCIHSAPHPHPGSWGYPCWNGPLLRAFSNRLTDHSSFPWRYRAEENIPERSRTPLRDTKFPNGICKRQIHKPVPPWPTHAHYPKATPKGDLRDRRGPCDVQVLYDLSSHALNAIQDNFVSKISAP